MADLISSRLLITSIPDIFLVSQGEIKISACMDPNHKKTGFGSEPKEKLDQTKKCIRSVTETFPLKAELKYLV